jgi:RNA polymerase-binding transcription factor
MPSDLSDKQINELKKELKQRFFELREEIRQELLESDNEHFSELAGQVHDMEEESVADLLVDLNLAIIDQHVEEIREIDAALLRIARGEYGACADCGDAIGYERLKVRPAAQRCHTCQVRFEQNYAQKGQASL